LIVTLINIVRRFRFDPPAPLSSVRKLLIHDVDLIVVDPFGNKWWGNRPMIVNHDLHTLDVELTSFNGRDRGNASSLGVDVDEVDWSDDRNPQEQVHIVDTRCPKNKHADNNNTGDKRN
jgi:hypothetical protein